MGNSSSSTKPSGGSRPNISNENSDKVSSGEQIPLPDSTEDIRRRLAVLASTNDPVYHAAFHEFITSSDIDRFLKSSLYVATTITPDLTVFRGDVYVKRYLIVSQIASTGHVAIWLAVDLSTYSNKKIPTCKRVAIKISRSEIHYSRCIWREIELKERVSAALEAARIPSASSPFVRVFEHFKVVGLRGPLICLVMERMRCDLYGLLSVTKSNRLPIHSVRLIARDCLQGLAFLHDRCGLVHTDIKPSNILVAVNKFLLASGQYRDRKPKAPGADSEHRRCTSVVKIGSLGLATEISEPRVVSAIGTPHYRAPEVLLTMHYGTNFDVWSLACTLFELLTGAKLFDPKPVANSEDEPEALLDEVYKVLGELPESLRHHVLAKQYLSNRKTSSALQSRNPSSIKRLLERNGYDQQQAAEIEEFLLPMLEIDPAKRVQCENQLHHPWLKSIM